MVRATAGRARVIRMLARGDSFTTIASAVRRDSNYIGRWKQRFHAKRLTGWSANCCGQPAKVRTLTPQVRILSKTRQRPYDGSTHQGTLRFCWSWRMFRPCCGWTPA